MAKNSQVSQLLSSLKEYKKRYLRKQYAELDEIKTEYNIRGEYADYVIQLERKKHIVIEVKAIQIDLSDNHLRQALSYAANEGIDWILLTNGRQFELYKVIFAKPIGCKKIFSYNLMEEKDLKDSVEYLRYLTKKSLAKGELNDFWKRFQALEPTFLCKNLYSNEVVRYLRKTLKQTTGLSFSDDDILDSINQIVVLKIDSARPKTPTLLGKKSKIKVEEIEKPTVAELSPEIGPDI